MEQLTSSSRLPSGGGGALGLPSGGRGGALGLPSGGGGGALGEKATLLRKVVSREKGEMGQHCIGSYVGADPMELGEEICRTEQ